MKLVKFNKSKTKEIYVNPDLVKTVSKYNSEKTMIYFNQGVIVVLNDVDYVVRKLTEKEEE